MKEGTRVLAALGLAIAVGALISASGNATALRLADSVAPIGSLWISAIRMTVLPLIASLIVTGIASAADGKSLGRLGARTIATFVLMLAGMAAIIVPVARLAFTVFPDGALPALPPGAAEAAREVAGAGQAHSFSAWLATLLPSNPVAAAANGDMVPFVLFVLLFAIAIAKSPAASRTTLVNFFRALGDAMMTLVRGVILLAPIGVPALLLPVAAHAGAALVGTIGLYIVVYSAACLFCVALLYPAVAIAGRISIARFAKAALPGQTIAFSSSSSVASLPALVRAAEVDLALPLDVTGFALPLAAAMFKIAGPVTWTVGSLFVAWFYNVPLGVSALTTIGFASVFLAFAAPGIPRGGFIMLTPLLVAVGLPAEGVGLLIAVDAIPDVFATVLNATGYLAATCVVAGGHRHDRSAHDR
jgi:Na+/H+-dicarboxylate symporter